MLVWHQTGREKSVYRFLEVKNTLECIIENLLNHDITLVGVGMDTASVLQFPWIGLEKTVVES